MTTTLSICVSLTLLAACAIWLYAHDLVSADFWFNAAQGTARWVAEADSVPTFAMRATIAMGGAHWVLSGVAWFARPFVWVWRLRDMDRR